MIRRAAPRRGFTLVEILVVIGIIAILVSLISVVAVRVQRSAKRTAAAAEIAQISNAIGAYKAKMNVGYIPSGGSAPGTGYFRLRAQYYDAPTGAQVSTSSPEAIYLKSLFPALPTTTTPPGFSTGAVDADLDANQTLLFFLTGGSDLTDFGGFSTNRQQPFEKLATNRIGPFITFDAKKYKQNMGSPGAATGASSLLDPWGSPYAYFTFYPGRVPFTPGLQNSYEPNEKLTFNGTSVQAFSFGGKALNLRGFQLISAGENGTDEVTAPHGFGAGGIWTPGQGDYAEEKNGADDVSNFNEGPLVSKN